LGKWVKEEVVDNPEKPIRKQGRGGYKDALLKGGHVVKVN
jgi:hypothetical protein